MVIRNAEKTLHNIFTVTKPFIDELCIFDQDSTDSTPEICRKWGAYYVKTTRKELADIDRQDCYNLATGDMVFVLDDDELPNNQLVKYLVQMKESGNPSHEVYWFKFRNLVDGIDVKELLGDDWHPRLWVRSDARTPVIEWPMQAHTFPSIKTASVLFCGKGMILHNRSLERCKRVHENRMRAMDQQNQMVEINWMNSLTELLRRKGAKIK